jgi:hypothetical protein
MGDTLKLLSEDGVEEEIGWISIPQQLFLLFEIIEPSIEDTPFLPISIRIRDISKVSHHCKRRMDQAFHGEEQAITGFRIVAFDHFVYTM